MLWLPPNWCNDNMINEETAVALFEPIHADIVKVVLESWRKIHASNLNFKARSRACLMFDEILDQANLLFCDSPHIQKIEPVGNLTARYWLNDRTFFRFKKGDAKGYTRNFPTQAALKFHEEESDLFGGTNRLELTYVLSQDQTEIIDIAVVHRNGGKVDFRFSLLNDENVLELPVTESAEAAPASAGNVAKLKSGLIQQDEVQSDNE
jgi:hypothetical protein